MACMKYVEEMGGMIQAVESGYIQSEVSYQAYLYQKKIQSGEIPKIGVNKYVSEEKEDREIEFHRFNPKSAAEQKKRLRSVKSSRDGNQVQKALMDLKEAAQTQTNLMPFILKAVRCYATLGEITKIFKDVFGEFIEPINI